MSGKISLAAEQAEILRLASDNQSGQNFIDQVVTTAQRKGFPGLVSEGLGVIASRYSERPWDSVFEFVIQGILCTLDAESTSALEVTALAARTEYCLMDSPGLCVSVGKYGDDSLLILEDRGMAMALHAMTTLAAAAVGGLLPQDTSASARAIMLTPRHIGRLLGVSEDRFDGAMISIQSLIMPAANAFLIAHELGHVSLGHCATRARLFVSEHRILATACDSGKEFAADRYATDLLFGHLASTNSIFRALGVRCLFAILEFVESHLYAISANTHPPADLRWGALSKQLKALGLASVPAAVDKLWAQVGLGSLAAPLPDGQKLLASMGRVTEKIGWHAYGATACSELSWVDAYFSMPIETHVRYAAEARRRDAGSRTRFDAASAQVDSVIRGRGGITWWALFQALSNAEHAGFDPAAISLARALISMRSGTINTGVS